MQVYSESQRRPPALTPKQLLNPHVLWSEEAHFTRMGTEKHPKGISQWPCWATQFQVGTHLQLFPSLSLTKSANVLRDKLSLEACNTGVTISIECLSLGVHAIATRHLQDIKGQNQGFSSQTSLDTASRRR